MGRFVVSVQGGQAVGKTTLTKKLQQRYPEIHFEFENPYPLVQKRKEFGLDITTEAGFVTNQKLFIEAECQRFHAMPDCKLVLDRGEEDIKFYTLHYPKFIGKDWDIEKLLHKELAALRLCQSDRILYLQASPTTLSFRKEKDIKRDRSWFEDYLQGLHPLGEKWFLALPHTVCIDVDEMNAKQVEKIASEWLEVEWRRTA